MSKCQSCLSLLLLLHFAALQAQNYPVFSGKTVALANNENLDGILSAYRVYDFEASELKAYLQATSSYQKQFTLDLPGLGAWPVALALRPLLPADYRLRVDDGYQIQEFPGPGDITWAGHLASAPGYEVSLTVDEGFVFGTIQTPQGNLFIEPLNNLLPGAPAGRFIVYRTSDVLPGAAQTCGVTEIEKKKSGQAFQASERQVGQCRHVELAIASDYDMFVRYTNAAGVETHNIGVMNEVANDYDDAFDDEIYFLVTTQYVSSTSTSSLDVALTATTDAEVLLDNFKTWGNAGNFGVSFDLGQLWVTRDICSDAGCSTIGIAYIGAVCGNSRYHLLEDYDGANPGGTGWELRVLTSHEIGHNFDGTHDAPGSPTIMAPSVSNTSSWSSQSVDEVGDFLPSVSCLSLCGVNFAASSATTSENVSAVYLPAGAPSCEMGYTELLIPVGYSGPASGGSVSVAVTGGTATENLDFDLPSTTIDFPPGYTNQTANLTVRIWNDAILESNETIELELTGGLAGSQNTATIFIVSDDTDPANSYYRFGQIGAGNTLMAAPFRGSASDCRTQIIFSVAELTAAGFAANDIINGIALEVTNKNSSQPYSGFTIKMKHTTAAPSPHSQPEGSGFTTVYSAAHTTSVGWNKFNFSQGFVWNGTSNLRVEFCYDNASATADDLVRASTGAATVFVSASSGSGCSLPTNGGYSFFSNARPNTRLYKGNEIAISLSDEADTNLKNGETAYFKDAQNEFILAIQQNAGSDAGCVNVQIDRAGTGRQTPPWLAAGYYISDKTFFVSSDNPSATYDITLYYSKAEVAVWGGSASDLNIIKSSTPIATADASTCTINETITHNTFGPAAIPDAYHSYKGTFTGFSGFALTNATQSLLPVEWLDFSAKLDGEMVLLSWATASEQDNRGFDVERSRDGVKFEKIGFVQGRGTIEQPQPYHFTDAEALQTNLPVLYYRLKQLDNDGAYSYSKIVPVNLPRSAVTWLMQPNPALNEVWLIRDDCPDCTADISVSDATSRIVLRQQVSGNSAVLSLDGLPKGVFVVTIHNDGGGVWQTKLLKI